MQMVYPELAKLMASRSMTKAALARLLNKTPTAITYKLQGKNEFKLSEAKIITDYFKQFKPSINSDIIFSREEVDSIFLPK